MAIANFTKAIKLDTTYAKAYYNRGVVYSNLEQYDNAISDFTRAFSIDLGYKEAKIHKTILEEKKREITSRAFL